MEVAPRYTLQYTVYTVYTDYIILLYTTLHCLNSSKYAYIYCYGRLEGIGMGRSATEQNVGWLGDGLIPLLDC